MQRLRITYAKVDAMRYTGNLDVHRAWERIFRRARLPLAYSQGFHPQPRINQAAPLPLGMTGQAEVVDVWLEEELAEAQVKQALEGAVPPGLLVTNVESVDLGLPKLQSQIVSGVYEALILEKVYPDLIAAEIEKLLSAETLPGERRGKTFDMRPLIEDLALLPADETGRYSLRMQLAIREGATGRPEEVLTALGINPSDARIARTSLLSAETAAG
jgi:radical SAM-linked protein